MKASLAIEKSPERLAGSNHMSRTEESLFFVQDMFCGGCAATVERAVRRLSGVVDVSVSFLGDTAIVLHNADKISADEVRSAITRLGYESQQVTDTTRPAKPSSFERNLKIRLGVAAGFGLWVMMASMVRLFIELPNDTYARALAIFSGVVALPVLCYSAAPFLRLGWLGIRQRVPGMDSLIFVATLSAVTGSLLTLVNGGSDVWFDVPVMLVIFQLIARIADFGAHRKASCAVRSLLDMTPVQAHRVNKAGKSELVSIAAIKLGERVQSYAGERLCLDGQIIEGCASLDTALINGEAMPVVSQKGDEVYAGTLNLDGTITLKVTNLPGKRRMDVLAGTVGRLLNQKSNLMKLVDQIAFWLVPVLIAASSCVAGYLMLQGYAAGEAIERALAVLVVSCPCALSLAIPLVVGSTATQAARQGILLRDASMLEKAQHVDSVLVDKTGTLTEGRPRIVDVQCASGYKSDKLLSIAAIAGADSRHPLMAAIVKRAKTMEEHETPKAGDQMGVEVNYCLQEKFERREFAGRGIRCVTACGDTILAGSRLYMRDCLVADVATSDKRIQFHEASEVCVAVNGEWIGTIYLRDALRPDAAQLIQSLRQKRMRVILASGDRRQSVALLAQQLDIEWRAQMSPEDKAELVEEQKREGRVVAFVGDGLNDGPALAAAHLGIATGESSDLARSACAMIILDGGLDKVVSALDLSAKSSAVLRSNLVLALAYNSILLPAAVFGFVHPVMAVVAMALSTLSVSINSLRVGTVNPFAS